MNIDSGYETAWQIFCTEFPGYEKWQRDEVYIKARKNGHSHAVALRKAKETPCEKLPEVIFETVKHE